MATEVTLEDLFEAAEKKYGDYVIRGRDYDGEFSVTLRPMLRMSEDERDAVSDLFKVDEDEDEEPKKRSPEAALKEFIRLVAADKGLADRLLAKIGPNRLDVLKEIQETWIERTQPGEAKPSQN